MIVLQVGALERVFPQISVTASRHNFKSVHSLTITIRACRREDFFLKKLSLGVLLVLL